jgi:putative glycosyltransferase (TIGR04372 family)
LFYFISKRAPKYFGNRFTKVLVYNWKSGDYSTFNSQNQICKFSRADHELGLLLLAELKIKENSKWVTVHNRDPAYLEGRYGRRLQNEDYRNFPVNDLVSLTKYYVENGYYVIRMGNIVQEKIDFVHPQVVDYPYSSYKSDFADIFLCGNACFHVGSESGLNAVATIFRKPVATLNATLFAIKEHVFWGNENYFVIFKNVKRKIDGYLLTIKEVIEQIPDGFHTDAYLKRGFEVVNNSEDEILQLGIEIEKRVNQTWVETSEDLELQKIFKAILVEIYPELTANSIKCKIGAHFLRKHQHLLK